MNTRLFCLVSLMLFLSIGIAACGGGDTEVEVIPEPEVVEPEFTSEPVEEIVPESEPEPVVETVDVPTLVWLQKWFDQVTKMV